MTTLSLLDASFLHLESHDTPMHIGSLMIFQAPAETDQSYVADLVARLRAPQQLAAPWNLRLASGLGRRWQPRWVPDFDVDMDYHVRHLALPFPGGERELGTLVSRLHGHRLDRRRPLWECHVIEGLSGGRFAMVIKMHHALADGIKAGMLMAPLVNAAPGQPITPPWAVSVSPAGEGELRQPLSRWLPDLAAALARLARPEQNGLCGLTQAPWSLFNGRISGQRRYATQQFELKRIKAVARAAEVSVNDVVLALCSGTLRSFLKEADSLPATSLVAGVPVSLRTDISASNAVSMLSCDLHTLHADPRARLQGIHQSMGHAKQHMRLMPADAQRAYSDLLGGPALAASMLGLSGRTRPPFNLVISNVAGPSASQYLGDARMVGHFPMSIPAHGQALNITCVSYDGQMNFGFSACRDSVPHMQRLAVGMGAALADLERALGLPTELAEAA